MIYNHYKEMQPTGKKAENGKKRGKRLHFSFFGNDRFLRLEEEILNLTEKNAQIFQDYHELQHAFDRLKRRAELLEDLTAVFVPDRRSIRHLAGGEKMVMNRTNDRYRTDKGEGEWQEEE